MAKKRKKKKKAKKRKVKRKAKRKVRRVKTRAKAMKKRTKRPTTMQSAYTLTMAGGIITLVAGILALFFSTLLSLIPIAGTTFIAALPNLICGIILLITAGAIKKNPRSAAVIVLVFSLIALIFPPHGFIVGPILALIGSIVLLVRR